MRRWVHLRRPAGRLRQHAAQNAGAQAGWPDYCKGLLPIEQHKEADTGGFARTWRRRGTRSSTYDASGLLLSVIIRFNPTR
jgi:hypothetical protein